MLTDEEELLIAQSLECIQRQVLTLTGQITELTAQVLALSGQITELTALGDLAECIRTDEQGNIRIVLPPGGSFTVQHQQPATE